jgi:hypothetical protein
MIEVTTDKDYATQRDRELALDKLKRAEKYPSSALAKITNANLEAIYYKIIHDKLKGDNVEINRLVTDLYCEVKRLRAICREILSEENYRIAHKWNERAA